LACVGGAPGSIQGGGVASAIFCGVERCALRLSVLFEQAAAASCLWMRLVRCARCGCGGCTARRLHVALLESWLAYCWLARAVLQTNRWVSSDVRNDA